MRRDGQKVLLSIRNVAGENEAAWPAVLDNLVARGLRTPEFLITDVAAGLKRARAALTPAQFSMLVEGIDWRQTAWTARPDVAV